MATHRTNVPPDTRMDLTRFARMLRTVSTKPAPRHAERIARDSGFRLHVRDKYRNFLPVVHDSQLRYGVHS